ncbi:hypothetical protein HK097_009930 [Rhizophlyctis rosea]|uniref:C2 domain-containing protein n=1 Tax=Rhizophlyctis rosea TaxID=64517 RepID=A0AAD5SLC6_9FUNG|nr:hypothetical protein HK097_009930 [Rhizophlyctis rosea]
MPTTTVSTAALSRSLHRLTKRRAETASRNNNAPNPHDVYTATLRCCLFPVLAASAPPAASNFYPQPQNQDQRRRDVIYDKANRAAVKAGLQDEVEKGGVAQADTVILSVSTMKQFKLTMATKLTAFELMQKDVNLGTFYRAGTKLLRERLQEAQTLQYLCNVKDLILVFGAYIDKEIPKDLPPADHDKTLFFTTELFLTTLREAVLKIEPSPTIRTHPIINEKDHLRSILSSFVKNEAEVSGDSNTSLSNWVRVVFEMGKQDHNLAVVETRKGCNNNVAFAELKTYMDLIARNQCPGSSPQDFESTQAYESWKRGETSILSGLINAFIARVPSAAHHRAHNLPISIPNDPQSYYRILLETCLKHDIQTSTTGEVALSKLSKAVLSECALRWRLSKEFKEIAILDLLVSNYRLGATLLKDLLPKFNEIVKLGKAAGGFRSRDREYYLQVLDTLRTSLINRILRIHDLIRTSTDPTATNGTMLSICYFLESIHTDPAWSAANPQLAGMDNLVDSVREVLLEALNERYRSDSNRVAQAFDREILRLTTLVKAVNQQLNKYRLFFKDPLFGRVSVGFVAAETYIKYFFAEMENMKYSLEGDWNVGEMLELYRTVRLLRDLCEESDLSAVKNFDVENWFAPFIKEWLTLTNEKWVEWVKSAVQAETYKPTLPPTVMASSSVFDLFTCFNSGLEFIQNLGWKDSNKKDKLVRDFIKMMSKALQEYASLMYKEFEDVENKNSSEMVEWSYESCIKLNNILAARQKLREVLDKLVDLDGAPPDKFDPAAARTEPEPDRALLYIKIIRAQGLQACDWTTSDPYVILSNGGNELYRTRVIDRTLDPVWNETFEIGLPESLPDNQSFLDLIVMDKDTIGSDDLCGQGNIFLRDSLFEDFLSHDKEIMLKPQGKVIVRVSRRGEIEDWWWWVKKAEEGLRFVGEDLGRVWSEQISRTARVTFNSLAFPSKTSHLLKSLSFLPSSTSASIPASEEIEQSLLPFLQYLDRQFGLWNETLDRSFNEWVEEALPGLGGGRARKRRKKKGIEDGSSSGAGHAHGELVGANVAERDPTWAVKMVYYDLLSLVYTVLIGFGSEAKGGKEAKKSSGGSAGPVGNPLEREVVLSKMEKRAVGIFDVVVEMVKSMCVCYDLGGGFELAELEAGRYAEVRSVVEKLLKC